MSFDDPNDVRFRPDDDCPIFSQELEDHIVAISRGQAPNVGRFCGNCYTPLSRDTEMCPHCREDVRAGRAPVDAVPDTLLETLRIQRAIEANWVNGFAYLGIIIAATTGLAIVLGVPMFRDSLIWATLFYGVYLLVMSRVLPAILGGYFGTWAPVDEAWELPLDPAAMKARGLTFGCGIVGVLGATGCGVRTTAEIMGYMADESAGQCGPCVYGLRAIADATRRVAGGKAQAGDLDDVRRWGGLVVGRGACHHPDGAAQLLASSLQVFAGEWDRHMRLGPCSGARARFDG